jgi:hypothetical protein|tara:strand:+ start:1914 stop:2414 length:501 start_codon:yes stop_codon:yes gene_type:complete
MTFNMKEFLDDMTVGQDDEELEMAMDSVKLTELGCDDAWLARQEHYGVAGAMERQIEYLGTTLLPSAEAKITKMSSDGVMGESYVADHWFGTSNSERPHESEEIAFDQQIEDAQNFADGLRSRMRTAAIRMVTRIRAHDEISITLSQLTYASIKSKAAANRRAKAA